MVMCLLNAIVVHLVKAIVVYLVHVGCLENFVVIVGKAVVKVMKNFPAKKELFLEYVLALPFANYYLTN
jgi:hypothetical protein